MRREDRAKQFLPFDAMKGLTEALREREEKVLRQEKKELDEEKIAALEATLGALKKGDRVEIVFFREGKYLTKAGVVTECDVVYRRLVSEREAISFDDLYSVRVL
ncbi:MAG: YolD-like family protein [Clostridia bacterium]|nr:YolD-like family protein [Clostridia bacterium]